MNYEEPISRAKALVGFSREHHYALLLCWKIKMGLAKNIAIDRINAYLQWFYTTHLLPHFEMEEKWLFPMLPDNNKHKQIALAQHQQLKALFEQPHKDTAALTAIQNILGEHIRFEERVLFNEIQNAPNFEQTSIGDLHQETKFVDNETDAFWK
ncbi:MAG: hemerythrin domain-containing protein [Chitinophagales bacterium]|nr:hemerythrin domain-containing protein [Chitinophagales bacterium]